MSPVAGCSPLRVEPLFVSSAPLGSVQGVLQSRRRVPGQGNLSTHRGLRGDRLKLSTTCNQPEGIKGVKVVKQKKEAEDAVSGGNPTWAQPRHQEAQLVRGSPKSGPGWYGTETTPMSTVIGSSERGRHCPGVVLRCGEATRCRVFLGRYLFALPAPAGACISRRWIRCCGICAPRAPHPGAADRGRRRR